MRIRTGWRYRALGLALILLRIPAGPIGQGPEERFFPETGHTVRGPFLRFFEEHGGLAFLGYPITPALPDPPYQIQCFQFACLRWDPLAAPEDAVGLLPIAEALGLAAPPLPPSRIPLGRPFRRYVAETGHTVSGMFLAFWLRHGGARGIGNPVTEPFVENGRLVQVFEGMKVTWDPRTRTARPMNLGEQYARARGLALPAAARLAPSSGRLQVRAVLGRPVLGAGEAQTIVVFVTDEGGQPVAGAGVQVHVPGAPPLIMTTDLHGVARGAFQIPAAPSGTLVEVHVVASDGVRRGETFTSYRVWP